MRLTIEELSKLTNLSISTLRVYASRQNLGKKVGNKRVFSQADVQKHLKSSKKAPGKAKSTNAKKKQGAKRKRIKSESIRTSVWHSMVAVSVPSTLSVKPSKASFWTRLFGRRRQTGG